MITLPRRTWLTAVPVALAEIITGLRQQGYTFATAGQLVVP